MRDFRRPRAFEAVSQQQPAPASICRAADLERIFQAAFLQQWRTCLRGGAAEPLYLPGREAGTPSTIFYRQDFFASALHEVAHWCLAGASRRQQQDYGYWYAPDGRNQNMQQRFELVEQKPQALEYLFALACGVPFRVSLDNLDGDIDAAREQRFALAVCQQAIQYCASDMPSRAATFLHALCLHYGQFEHGVAKSAMLGHLQQAKCNLSLSDKACPL
ncbi:MAG: elongation factor P hydroxylase [Gammaproteobacteria bacterium]|nr:elongation factor P hydroxylase [Gammaproteobacteria bacterium]NND39250.1 hypothetical protein [Pseudomonadales bacterium]MBT8151359.1 elongation factor P hydroxylase [Gammaproteobacteria bacterium]NNL10359.1 hypothetical protein [Pseudomonadales bacterium]NNM12012.1 hypothetical protein [Pseudomonadales bacterium]